MNPAERCRRAFRVEKSDIAPAARRQLCLLFPRSRPATASFPPGGFLPSRHACLFIDRIYVRKGPVTIILPEVDLAL